MKLQITNINPIIKFQMQFEIKKLLCLCYNFYV
jgi:hypothetical protein